jgi:hypothetical protein
MKMSRSLSVLGTYENLSLHHTIHEPAVMAYVQFYLHHTQRKIKNNVKQSEKIFVISLLWHLRCILRHHGSIQVIKGLFQKERELKKRGKKFIKINNQSYITRVTQVTSTSSC